jgi:hypothetical protein
MFIPIDLWSVIVPYADHKTVKQVRLLNRVCNEYFHKYYKFRLTEKLVSHRDGLDVVCEHADITRETTTIILISIY